VSSAILRDPPPPPRSVRGDLPPDLDRIIERCLAKDPERRVQTAKDVRNELEHLRRAVGPDAAPPRRERRAVPSAESEAPSIAVLPFANRSAGPEDEYFSDGLADELISVLVKIRGLRVAARTSSASFKGKNATIAEVGQALNVKSVLEGSVRKAGNRVRISVQLVKVENGDALWSETYDRTLDDIFAVQDDIAQSVVKELRTTLLGESPDSDASGAAKAEVAAAAEGRGQNAEAHRLLLEGRFFLERMSNDGIARGVTLLEQATALDPGYAKAWAELARGYWQQGAFGYVTVVEGHARARKALDRALALAPDLPEALLVLAQIEGIYEWDLVAAEANYRKALAAEPGNANVLEAVGLFLVRTGRPEEGHVLLQRALEQDPLSVRTWSALMQYYRVTGRKEDAIACGRKVLALAPDRISTHHVLGYLLASTGHHDEALAEAQAEPAPWAKLTGLAAVHHYAGRKSESQAALDRLLAEHADESAFQIAAVYAMRGEVDESFRWIDHALATRDAGAALVPSEPIFHGLHDDPRWPEVLRRLGFDRLPKPA
jgi:TolB-like protein/Tfp pilus assembly protein PilF